MAFLTLTSLFVTKFIKISSLTVVVAGFGPGPSLSAAPNFFHACDEAKKRVHGQ